MSEITVTHPDCVLQHGNQVKCGYCQAVRRIAYLEGLLEVANSEIARLGRELFEADKALAQNESAEENYCEKHKPDGILRYVCNGCYEDYLKELAEARMEIERLNNSHTVEGACHQAERDRLRTELEAAKKEVVLLSEAPLCADHAQTRKHNHHSTG